MYNPSAGRATGYASDQMELDPPTDAEESDAVEVDDIDSVRLPIEFATGDRDAQANGCAASRFHHGL